jgi:hypothetical protein
MCIAAAGFEANRAVTKPSGLALNAREPMDLLDGEVAARVFAEREVNRVARFSQSEHDGERRSVTDRLRVFHKRHCP